MQKETYENQGRVQVFVVFPDKFSVKLFCFFAVHAEKFGPFIVPGGRKRLGDSGPSLPIRPFPTPSRVPDIGPLV